jgi:hypothetical protein
MCAILCNGLGFNTYNIVVADNYQKQVEEEKTIVWLALQPH